MKKLKTHFLNAQKLPLVIEPENAASTLKEQLEAVKNEEAALKKHLLTHGGLLFRNFSIGSVDDFVALMKTVNTGQSVKYIGGGSPRTKVKESVYTSTEAPPAIKIHLHNELSFTDNYPSHIYFYCDIEPTKGGETFIADARKVVKDVRDDVKNRLAEKKIKYYSRYYFKSWLMDLVNKIQRGHKTWIDVFETDSKKEVEEICRKNNFGFKWNRNDWLEITRVRPALNVHPVTGETAWFNQVHLFDYNPRFLGWWRYIGMRLFYFQRYMLVDEVCYADGTKIPRSDIYHIVDVLDANSIYFPWKKGDVMLLDNILTMHGRAPFEGKRKILAAMTR